jgi:hypothetical protein
VARIFAATLLALTLSGCGVFGDDPEEPPPTTDLVRIVATRTAEKRGNLALFHTERAFKTPAVDVVTGPAEGTDRGYVFLTPRAADPDEPTGPTIRDWRGNLIYHRPLPNRVSANLTPQVYKGKRVLTWGERPPVATPADIFKVDPEDAFHVIVDTSYEEVAKVRAQGEGVGTDMHELVITKRGTALLIGFRITTKDLTEVGGAPNGQIAETIVQEVDIATGKLVFEWAPTEHVPITDSMFPLPQVDAWDAYHVNTVSEARDGNLLVTMRHTSAIYKIDRKSGKVIWTLGGESGDFRRERGTRFYFAHDAHELPNGNLLVFDNGATDKDRRSEHSRVIELKLDHKSRRVSLVREIVHDPPILSISQGNARVLENGNVFVGWGNRQWFSEYTRHGQQLFDGSLPSSSYHSYRAFKGPWPAKPHGRPGIVASHTRGRTLIYASWNGATEIAEWRVLGGPGEARLKPIGAGDWQGFETKLDVARVLPVVQVEALDKDGNVLGRSDVIRPEG